MDARGNQSLVVSFEEARRIVEERALRLPARVTETVDLLRAAGRVLAERITADRDMPPFPRATRDGYAVRASDVIRIPARLKLMGEIKAGAASSVTHSVVGQGETFSIMTGAPVPQGADAVVMVEYTSNDGGWVEISRGVTAGANTVARGAEARQGDVLIEKGTRLNEGAVAVIASVGKAQVDVFERPRVAVLATGDEIVEVGAEVGATQIRNSNSYSLAVQVERAGGEAVILPIAPDEPRRLRELIEQGLECDLLAMSGGVSMGRYDLVEQVLAEMQAEFFFTGAKIQPGRPVVFGQVAEKYFFGLPGNPVSTMVTFELFARPMIEAFAGMTAPGLMFLHARLKSELRVKTGLKRFLPGILSELYEDSWVEIVPWQGSGDIAAQARANCYVVIAEDREKIEAGEWVPVMVK